LPNWCGNRLTVEGAAGALDAFQRAVVGTMQEDGVIHTLPLSFERILPTPPDLLTDAEQGWYAWRLAHWGTKWDVGPSTDVAGDPADGRLVYTFDTAWDPPRDLIEAASARYDDVRFHLVWAEPGNELYGEATYARGTCTGGRVVHGEAARRMLASVGLDDWYVDGQDEDDDDSDPVDADAPVDAEASEP
jgi:hypothetical protein